MRLEKHYGLNKTNPHHLWLLAVLFMQALDDDCQLFVDEWNHHSLHNPDINSMTPFVSTETCFIEMKF